MSGGHYGHNGGRQQRKRPRDFDDDQYRRPRTIDTLEKIKRDLTKLADPGNSGNLSATEDMQYVAKLLAVDFESSENQGRILDVLRDCILQFSVKTSHYAITVCLAAAQNQHFGQEVVTMVIDCLSRAFEHRAWRDSKLLLRFLAAMNPCLASTGTTVPKILDGLTEKILQSNATERTEFADDVCYLVMITIPYVVASTASSEPRILDDMTRVLAAITPYMSVRKVSPDSITYHYVKADHDKEYETLQLLFEQCQQTASEGWSVKCVPCLLESFASDSVRYGSLEAPALALPEQASVSGSLLSPPQFHLQIFNDQPIDSVPPIKSLATTIYRDMTTDILDLFVFNRKDAARFLIDFESYLPEQLFVLRGTPLDKIQPGQASWKAEDIVVEGIFSQLFVLPRPANKSVYYHSVLTELCKLVPQAIAPTFGRAIRILYNRLQTLEPEVSYRFWDWFSHHLSNFGFNWKWNEWIDDLSLPTFHPKIVFIRETIMKEAELSYNQRIKNTLPEEYHHIIPDDAPGPNFPHSQSEAAFFDVVQKLQDALSTGATHDQLEELMKSIKSKATDLGLDENRESLGILVHCVLFMGHQSFSHALNTIESNLPLLQQQCDASNQTRRTTVASVMKFWSGRPLIASTLLQKLLNYRIVSPLSILEYLFLDTESVSHGQSQTLELVNATIDKANARIVQVKNRLEKATELTAGDQDQVDASAQEELSRLEKTWTEVQKEQKEVLTFILQYFTPQNAGKQQDEWAAHWSQGMFRELLRRYRAEFMLVVPEIVSSRSDLASLLA